ncbi:ATP-binding cassette domain-containing protein [Streptomyces sp. NBC_01275]|uniref:ATP-binding cassette domain-containing protein n=1 Tax=Streptomyces sp. NBC_01275 TaxID=2903807 RepID=UPI00224F8A9C|nr:ATP-binding cassette domain-containing protein [Streptomyces sp. NBC_01275]MCX4768022.1 ATP-binding cassette domain-containing protein [Streptomyces sp. NBC_01275]
MSNRQIAADTSDTAPDAGVLAVRDYSIAFATAQGPRTVVDSVSTEDVTGVHREAPGTPGRSPCRGCAAGFTIGSQLCEVVRRTGGVTGGKDAVRRRVRELLTSVHLRDPDDVVRRHPHELSGGMVQRAVIAMALAGSPKVLIADEPTTALDVTVQAGILDLLRSLRDERGMAIILITHDLGVVADTCDRAIVMERGRIVEEGPIEDIFYRPRHPTRAFDPSAVAVSGLLQSGERLLLSGGPGEQSAR